MLITTDSHLLLTITTNTTTASAIVTVTTTTAHASLLLRLFLLASVDRIPPGSRPILSGSCPETCTPPRRNTNFISIRRSDPTKIPSNPVRILPRNVLPASAKRTFYFHPSIGSHQDPVQSRQDPATKRAPRLSETHISSSCVEDDPVGSCIRSRRFCRKTQRKIDFISLSLTLIYITK